MSKKELKMPALGDMAAVRSVLSIVLAILIASIFILIMGKSPVVAFQALFNGAFGNSTAVANTLNKTVPLIFTGLAASVAFKSGLLNIGIEGQLHMGALFSITVALKAPDNAPRILVILGCILMGMVGGMLWGALTGFLKERFKIHEVILAILLNYIAIEFVSYMVNYPLQSEAGLPETDMINASFRFTTLVSRTQLSTSIFIALIAVAVVYIVINRTVLGYKIRAVGSNATAAQAGGIGISLIAVMSMAFSGALGGLAGTAEALGTYGKVFDGFSGNAGFTGLAVAVLAGNNPFLIILTGLLFGIMDSGARQMSIKAGLTAEMVIVIQGLVIFFVATPRIFSFLSRKKEG